VAPQHTPDVVCGEHSVFALESFYGLMLTAFMLNISVPLTIRWWKPRMDKQHGLSDNRQRS
jgi:hypothetical protein